MRVEALVGLCLRPDWNRPVDDLRGLTGLNTDYFRDFSLQRWSRLELRRLERVCAGPAPRGAQALAARGRALWLAGRRAEGVCALERAAAAGRGGEPERAWLEAARGAREGDSRWRWAGLWRGYARLRAGDALGALQATHGASGADGRLLEGLAARAAGRSAESSRAFDAAARARPDVAGFWLLAGRARLALGDRTGAVARFSSAVAAHPDAIEGFALLLGPGADSFDGTHEGSPDEAIRRRLTRVLRAGRGPWWAYALRGSCRFARVRDAAEAGRARADLEHAARLNPRARWLDALLAQLLWHSEPELALSHVKRACRGLPGAAWPLAWRGQISLQMQRAGGERDLARAVKRAPDYALARAWLAGARLERGLSSAAEKELDAALRLNPEHSLSLYLLAQARRRRGDAREALVLLTRAVLREPESERFFHPGATPAQARGDVRVLSSLRKAHPGDAAIRLWLGQAQMSMGRPREAAAELEAFSTAICGNRRLDALAGWAAAWRARCHAAMGREARGRALRREALDLNPGIGYFRGC
jgi:tetratricopeptide (TPR) repeat protein